MLSPKAQVAEKCPLCPDCAMQGSRTCSNLLMGVRALGVKGGGASCKSHLQRSWHKLSKDPHQPKQFYWQTPAVNLPSPLQISGHVLCHFPTPDTAATLWKDKINTTNLRGKTPPTCERMSASSVWRAHCICHRHQLPLPAKERQTMKRAQRFSPVPYCTGRSSFSGYQNCPKFSSDVYVDSIIFKWPLHSTKK